MNAEYWQRLVRILTQGDLPVKEGRVPLERDCRMAKRAA
jgi:hypothetical protein